MLGVYCRTSKSRKDKYTIDNQREGGIACAAKLGIGYRIYIDDGISGTLDESVRDGLSDLFRDIRNKEISNVYCIDQSRIERDSKTWQFFVAECLNNNIGYYPNGSFFDLDNPTNRMYASLMSIVNAYYAEITSKKVRLANARKAREGKTHGLKPYGYKKGIDNKYEIFEDEAKNLKRMFELSLSGVGAYTIANIFNDENIPTKFSGNFSGVITRKDKYTKVKTRFKKADVKWRGNVISDMLKNKMYKGVREWNRHEDTYVFENGKQKKVKKSVELITSKDIPIIIEPSLWDAVNANLAVNKTNVGKKEQYHYLLNGLLFCGHCQNEILGKKRLKGNDNAYKCKGSRLPLKNCDQSRGLSLPKIETFVIHHLFKSKTLKNLLIEAPRGGSESNKLRTAKQKKEKERDIAERTVAHFEKLLMNPNIKNLETFINEHTVWSKKLYQINSEIDSLTNQIAEVESNVRTKRTKSLIESFTTDIEFDDLKRIIHSLIERIDIAHNKEEKAGFFTLVIKYRNYDEYSTFFTNWQALKWSWHNHYRGAAYSEQDLEEDYKLERYLAKKNGRKPIPKKDFKGHVKSTLMHSDIILKVEDLIYFD